MISFDALTAQAAVTFGYTEDEILAKGGRSERITKARQALMWAARYHDYGTVEIGRYMGGRDHTTIISGSRQAARRAESDPAYARALREVAGLPEPAEERPRRVPVVQVPGYRLALAA